MKLAAILLFVCDLVRTFAVVPVASISYYSKENPSKALVTDKTSPIFFSNDNLITVYIIHGWKADTLENPEKLKNAIFEARSDVGRVVIIDWMNASRNPYGIASKVMAPEVAKLTAEEITRTINNGMSTAANVELIGHSLGAHIAGQAGNLLNSQKVGPVSIITGNL